MQELVLHLILERGKLLIFSTWTGFLVIKLWVTLSIYSVFQISSNQSVSSAVNTVQPTIIQQHPAFSNMSQAGFTSQVENQNDLELDFKVFFFADFCCLDIVLDESN